MFELTDLLEIHILELPKLHKQGKRSKNNKLIPWMNFLYAQTREELDMASEANPVIQKATDMLMAMSRDEEERLRYEAREEFLLDQQYRLQAARGEGIEEGIIKNKQETARKLITKGMDDQFIREITGLELEEISSLRDEQKV